MAEQELPVVERNRCNCAALRKASRHMTLFYDAALEPSGLRSTQYALLTEIHRRGDAAPSIGDLAEALVMDQSTIGQNLRPKLPAIAPVVQQSAVLRIVVARQQERRRAVLRSCFDGLK